MSLSMDEENDIKKESYKKIKKDPLNRIMNVFLATGVGIFATILIIQQTQTSGILEQFLSGWVTLIIEIGIGIAITGSIFVYEKSQQEKSEDEAKEMAKTIHDLTDIVIEQKKMLEQQECNLKEEREINQKLARSTITRTIIGLTSPLKEIYNANSEKVELDPQVKIQCHDRLSETFYELRYVVERYSQDMNSSDTVHARKITKLLEMIKDDPKKMEDNSRISRIIDSLHRLSKESKASNEFFMKKFPDWPNLE